MLADSDSEASGRARLAVTVKSEPPQARVNVFAQGPRLIGMTDYLPGPRLDPSRPAFAAVTFVEPAGPHRLVLMLRAETV